MMVIDLLLAGKKAYSKDKKGFYELNKDKKLIYTSLESGFGVNFEMVKWDDLMDECEEYVEKRKAYFLKVDDGLIRISNDSIEKTRLSCEDIVDCTDLGDGDCGDCYLYDSYSNIRLNRNELIVVEY